MRGRVHLRRAQLQPGPRTTGYSFGSNIQRRLSYSGRAGSAEAIIPLVPLVLTLACGAAFPARLPPIRCPPRLCSRWRAGRLRRVVSLCWVVPIRNACFGEILTANPCTQFDSGSGLHSLSWNPARHCTGERHDMLEPAAIGTQRPAVRSMEVRVSTRSLPGRNKDVSS